MKIKGYDIDKMFTADKEFEKTVNILKEELDTKLHVIE